jgi:hypothetical protein
MGGRERSFLKRLKGVPTHIFDEERVPIGSREEPCDGLPRRSHIAEHGLNQSRTPLVIEWDQRHRLHVLTLCLRDPAELRVIALV